MKSDIDLTHVMRGTYKRIAESLGYSEVYVSKVARGERHNAIIEEQLLREVLRRTSIETRNRRLKRMIRDGKNQR